MSKALSQLLEKEVTRKEFLQFTGTALIALLGLNNFLALVTRFTHGASSTTTSDPNERHGFGSSRFGM
ncbi:MAG: hypothetical protein ABIR37_01125 [Candidatus Saccharimonadales bacterium]